MELPHTAAAVILGGLATTALVCLFVLPLISRLLGPALTAAPVDTLAEIAMAGQPAAGIAVPTARQAAEPPDGQVAQVGAGVEQPLVRDSGDVPPDGPPADPPGGQASGASGSREDA